MGGFSVKVEGLEGTQAAFAELARRGQDQTPAWVTAGEVLMTSMEDTFAAEGRPEPWTSRAASTLASIERGTHRSGWRRYNKILMRTGHLKRSISTKTWSLGVMIGTNVVYSRIHQCGGTAGNGAKIPARPFLVLQPEDLTEITNTIADYLVLAMKV